MNVAAQKVRVGAGFPSGTALPSQVQVFRFRVRLEFLTEGQAREPVPKVPMWAAYGRVRVFCSARRTCSLRRFSSLYRRHRLAEFSDGLLFCGSRPFGWGGTDPLEVFISTYSRTRERPNPSVRTQKGLARWRSQNGSTGPDLADAGGEDRSLALPPSTETHKPIAVHANKTQSKLPLRDPSERCRQTLVHWLKSPQQQA